MCELKTKGYGISLPSKKNLTTNIKAANKWVVV